MAVIRFLSDKARELGLDINSRGPFPEECYERTYAGTVLEIYEINGYDDSDFMAIVWDAEKQLVKSVQYATTRGWTYNNSASVDATPEVREVAAAYWYAAHRATVERVTRESFTKPYVGAEVIVKRGRKVPQGFRGKVLSLAKRAKYHQSRWGVNSEIWVFITDGNASWEVKAEYCEVVRNESVEASMLADALSTFDARRSTNYNGGMSFQSAPYEAMNLAGVKLSGGL